MTIRYRDLPAIPINQLRVGNIVQIHGIKVCINSISSNYCRVTFNHPYEKIMKIVKLSELRPITINEDRIEVIGFLKLSKYLYHKGGCQFNLAYNGENTFHIRSLCNTYIIAEGNFVNQLQNYVTDLETKDYIPQ